MLVLEKVVALSSAHVAQISYGFASALFIVVAIVRT